MAGVPDDPLDYPAMLRDALRSVVQRALRVVEAQGFPGEHHFYISFRTDHAGVGIPDTLRRQYPTEMTIVLQHQFWNLLVEDDAFSVDLRFGGVLSRLTVPFDAVTAFADPSAELGLRFEPVPDEAGEKESAAKTPEPVPVGPQPVPDPPSGDGNVVDIRQFRKK